MENTQTLTSESVAEKLDAFKASIGNFTALVTNSAQRKVLTAYMAKNTGVSKHEVAEYLEDFYNRIDIDEDTIPAHVQVRAFVPVGLDENDEDFEEIEDVDLDQED